MWNKDLEQLSISTEPEITEINIFSFLFPRFWTASLGGMFLYFAVFNILMSSIKTLYKKLEKFVEFGINFGGFEI